ncbi:MAG: gluconokinase, partial [Candidatus Binataceae bacterium]
PKANVEKMRRGVALGDEDRWPWLDAVSALIDKCLVRGANAVIACSALKQAYRERLVADRVRVKVAYLKGTHELIAARLAARSGHFFNHDLLRSQFDTLEEPPDAITVDVTADAGALADAIAAQLHA